MQATFTKSAFSDIKESAIKASRNQALIHQYSVIAETKKGFTEVVIARLYAPLRRGAIKTTRIFGHGATTRFLLAAMPLASATKRVPRSLMLSVMLILTFPKTLLIVMAHPCARHCLPSQEPIDQTPR